MKQQVYAALDKDPFFKRLYEEKKLVTRRDARLSLSLIHISEPTRLLSISYAVFCLKKKKKHEHTRSHPQVHQNQTLYIDV